MTRKKKMTAHKKSAPAQTPAQTPTQTWVVTTSSDRPLADIAKDLSAAEFKIDQHSTRSA